jgi:hypothetical protein
VFATFMLVLLPCWILSSILMSLLVGLVGSLLPPHPLLYPDVAAAGPGGVLDSHIIYIQVSAVFATYIYAGPAPLPDPLLYPDVPGGGPGGVLDFHIFYIQVSTVFATYMFGLLPRQTLSSVLMSLLAGLVGSLILIYFIFRYRLCLPPICWACAPARPSPLS